MHVALRGTCSNGVSADETLTARVHPIFNDIFVKLEPLALKGSSALRPLAREARLVITARLANVSSSKKSGPRKQADEDDQEVYQKALKLLQDPILPVRAHGLLLLRELVSNSSVKGHKVNSALVPSILSIFLQAVQDEDSYMFLNAVQGLAALADTFGKEIIQGLVHDYAGGLDGLGAGNLTQQDLDIRLRIGEALGSIIQRRGTALGLYGTVFEYMLSCLSSYLFFQWTSWYHLYLPRHDDPIYQRPCEHRRCRFLLNVWVHIRWRCCPTWKTYRRP